MEKREQRLRFPKVKGQRSSSRSRSSSSSKPSWQQPKPALPGSLFLLRALRPSSILPPGRASLHPPPSSFLSPVHPLVQAQAWRDSLAPLLRSLLANGPPWGGASSLPALRIGYSRPRRRAQGGAVREAGEAWLASELWLSLWGRGRGRFLEGVASLLACARLASGERGGPVSALRIGLWA